MESQLQNWQPLPRASKWLCYQESNCIYKGKNSPPMKLVISVFAQAQ